MDNIVEIEIGIDHKGNAGMFDPDPDSDSEPAANQDRCRESHCVRIAEPFCGSPSIILPFLLGNPSGI
jgi:hypothetical protein